MAKAKTARNTETKHERDRSISDEQTFSLNERARAEIQRRAYEIYLARGEVHGYDEDDWLQAERELGDAQSQYIETDSL